MSRHELKGGAVVRLDGTATKQGFSWVKHGGLSIDVADAQELAERLRAWASEILFGERPECAAVSVEGSYWVRDVDGGRLIVRVSYLRERDPGASP